MEYLFTNKSDLSDFASGSVLYSLPGYSAFPIRLMSEIFQQCLALIHKKDNITIYDPCCGSAYHLTALGFLHHHQIKILFCSDIDDDILTVARKNLCLLTSGGIDARIETIMALYKQFGKLSHKKALDSAYRLKSLMQDSAIETRCFNSNILHTPDYHLITKMKIDIVFADIPYEFLATWQGNISGEDEVWLMLDNLLPVVNPDSLIIIASPKKKAIEHSKYTRIGKLSAGRRKISIFRPLN